MTTKERLESLIYTCLWERYCTNLNGPNLHVKTSPPGQRKEERSGVGNSHQRDMVGRSPKSLENKTTATFLLLTCIKMMANTTSLWSFSCYEDESRKVKKSRSTKQLYNKVTNTKFSKICILASVEHPQGTQISHNPCFESHKSTLMA